MKQLFVFITLSNLLTFNSYAQNCSVVQETADLGIGYSCNTEAPMFAAMDDFFVPAGQNWFIDRVKLNIVSVDDLVASPPFFNIEFGTLINNTWNPVAFGEGYEGTFNAITPVFNGDEGTTYEFDLDFPYPAYVSGGVSGQSLYMLIYAYNELVDDLYWEVDTNSVNNHGLNGLVTDDFQTWNNTNADFVFEIFYKMHGYEVQNVCDSFTWIDGNTYTHTSQHDYIFPGAAANGCDSAATLVLTVNNTANHIDTIEACSEYTWINGITYTESTNTPQFTFPGGAANGCDSVVTLNLDIDVSAHVSYNANENTIIASGGALFQWIDCGTNTPIMGATSSIFTPEYNGSFAAIITNDGTCADTSDCVEINNLGMTNKKPVSFTVFPNPSHGKVTVLYSGIPAQLTVLDQRGTVVLMTFIDGNKTIDIDPFATGVYTIELKVGNTLSRQRLVKL